MDDYLKEKRLSPEKWGPLFAKEGITKPEHIQVVSGSHDMYTALSADATDEEKEILRSLLNIQPIESCNLDIEVEKQLTSAALEPDYWLPIFKSKLGVKSPEALRYVGSESYALLKPHVRYAWENRALRRLLGMEDEETALRLQRDEQIKRQESRHERSEKLLQDLKGHLKDGKDRQDATIKQLESGICEALQIPADSWIPHDTTLETLIGRFETSIDQFGTTLKTRSELSEVKVLQNASGGRALQGILLSEDFKIQLEDRGYMLRVPEDIQFKGPCLGQSDSVEYFTSKHQEDQFTKSLEKLGVSVTAAAKAGFLGYGIGVTAAFSKGVHEEGTKQHHQQELYSSTVKYSIVPLASCHFKESQLQLSDEALKELRGIEKTVLSSGSASTIQQQCELFFEKFGSHVNKGPLHFGGIYCWKSYSKGFQEKDMEEVKRIQNEAVNVSANLGYGAFGISTEVSVSRLKAGFHGTFDETLISKTSMKVTKTGGPVEVSDLPQWKIGLVASNSTWSLIDRGSNPVPVWDIIKNHIKDFEDQENLSQVLSRAHGQMIKHHMDFVHAMHAMVGDKDALKLLTNVKSWNESLDSSQCEVHLNELFEAKQSLAEKSMTLQTWPTVYLSKGPIQRYLKWVVDVIPELSEERPEYIRLLMKQVMNPSDIDLANSFPEKYYISKWVYQTDNKEGIIPLECRDILSLNEYLTGALHQLYSAEVKGDAIGDAEVAATIAVSQVVRHLRDHLHKAHQKYEDLFIVTLLYPFGYDPGEKIFVRGHSFSIPDLNYLSKELEKESIVFFDTKEEGLMKVQAYLFHLSCEFHNNKADLDVSEHQIKDHIEYIRKKLGSDIDREVDKILTNCQYGSSYDWQHLLSELSGILHGVHPSQRKGGTHLNDILKPRDESDHDIVQFEPHIDIPVARNLQGALKKLHLTEYYPQKLTVQDALTLRHETLEQCELLPHCILQRIMMHDYVTRSYLPHQVSTEVSDTSDSEEESEDESAVHPMDGLLAVLCCSDNFLRQKLFAKLSTCQLAIPLLLPDPITQTLTFPLWAMRSIVKEWRCKQTQDGEIISMDHRIVDYRAPVVSFVRFSKSRTSKSKKLNDVICDSQHDIFLHYDSKDGNIPRVLVGGLVEVCWYLPSGKESDPFPDVITFTNLHGDARCHDMQTAFLCNISAIFCVMLSGQEDLNERSISVLQKFSKSNGGMVLMFSNSIPKNTVDKALSNIPREKYYNIYLERNNASKVKDKVWKWIRKNLGGGVGQLQAISQYAKIARCNGVYVDEDDPECIKGKKLAEATLKDVLKDSIIGVKAKMLPLQGGELWQKWANDDKEEHRHAERGYRRIDEYTAQKKKDKLRIRQEQLFLAEYPTELMESFIKTLVNHKGNTRNYFLEWMQFVLDDLSKQTLPDIWNQYQSERKWVLQLKDKTGDKTQDLNIHKHKLGMLDEQLAHASIGLEHLLRELGQVYEAVANQEEVPQDLKVLYGRLPQIAAELLIAGYPLELMDGDAAHIPLEWVMAVLDKVKGQLGDVRLFVLSVLGVQSSGKSTLLNTMFGLQFMVRAGRCTRGAFIQLLPLDDKLKQDVGCDYVLVVDTEGLRAPEIDPNQAQKHDNEMATFVIGLADVTIINIFGEIAGDIDDILQTAVHAFIRMKKVGIHPRVQFVHQNVASISASSKTKMGTYKFQEKLDTMTKTAATEEKCESQYISFKDVIYFSENTDIWYFPTLWKGDPPMAPVNPGYSEATHRLRSRLIKVLKSKGSQSGNIDFRVSSHLTLSDLRTRMNDLWRAVLQENFVFSFKNTIELSAYNKLDAQYCQWSWILQRKMMKWERKAENMIDGSDVKELVVLEHELTRELQEYVESIHEDLKKKMKDFFDNNEHRTITVQWKCRTELRLEDMHKQRQAQAEKWCITLISSKQALEKVEEMQKSHRSKLLHYVKALVSELGDNLTETEQEAMFEEKWIGWLQEFTTQSPSVFLDDVNVESSIEECLKKLLNPYYGLVIKGLKDTPLQSQMNLKIIKEVHIGSSRWGGFRRLQSADVDHAQKKTDQFFEKSKRYLKDLKKRRTVQNFKEAFAEELLQDLIQSINAFEEVEIDKHFHFKPQYKVDLALAVAGYAVPKFEAMKRRFRMNNDPVEYLKRMKEQFRYAFKGLYSRCAQEKAAAVNLCSLLAKPIEAAVTDSLTARIVEDMKTKSGCFSHKKSLKARILYDLAELEDFSHYATYLTQVSISLRSWIKKYTLEHCTDTSGGTFRLCELAEVKLHKVILHIVETAQRVTKLTPESGTTISIWLSELHRQVRGKLSLNQKEIQEFLKFGTLQDFDYRYFTTELTKELGSLQDILMVKFQAAPATQMARWRQTPYDIMYDNLAGCTEQCPFCKAQCELSDPQHACKHTVELHRPECVGGARNFYTDKMSLAICNEQVASNGQFLFQQNPFHPYKKYQTYFPRWSITPDLSLKAESYWKWFVANYSADIAKHYRMVEVEIPEDWKSLTWKKVKEDLEKLYHT